MGTWMYPKSADVRTSEPKARTAECEASLEATDTPAGARLSVYLAKPGGRDYETKARLWLNVTDERRLLVFLLSRWTKRLAATLESEAQGWRSPVWSAALEAANLALSLIGRVEDIHLGTANPEHTGSRMHEILQASTYNLTEIQEGL